MKPESVNRLVEEALQMERETARDAGALGFLPRPLVQATLPHRDPGRDVATWGRVNGSVSLLIRAGEWLEPSGRLATAGLPWGSLPRLLVAYAVTEAVRTREPVIRLGTVTEFLRALGMTATGGREGSIRRVRDQLRRTFTARITCTVATPERHAALSLDMASGVDLWWTPARPDQPALWSSTLTLRAEFFAECIEHPIPVDLRALRALRRSPLALDLYAWLSWRLSYLTRPTVVPWEALAAQFGADYGRERAFRAALLAQLRAVAVVYPEARFTVEPAGLRLNPSPPHVARALPPWRPSGSGG